MLNASIEAMVPTIMAPRYGQHKRLETQGRRYVAASNGLWLEFRTTWCYVLWPFAVNKRTSTPYGDLKPTVEVAFGRMPEDLIEEFVTIARQAHPMETGAFVVMSSEGRLRLVASKTLQASESRLRFEPPNLEGDEVCVIDMHSHGGHDAFFSQTDKDDMGHTTVIAGVVGNLDRVNPSFEFALFCCGLKIPIGQYMTKTGGPT